MYKYYTLIIALTVFMSCRSTKINSGPQDNRNKNSKTVEQLVNYAQTFNGTPYLYGGTTKKGMDCSGLIYSSYKFVNKTIPRTTLEMSKKGKEVPLKKVKKGDLLFFKTSKKRNTKVNHVGLVTALTKNEIYFIHASTSKGVMVSKLTNPYWKKAFIKAKRFL